MLLLAKMLNLTQLPKIINFICIVIYGTLNQQVNIKKVSFSGMNYQISGIDNTFKTGKLSRKKVFCRYPLNGGILYTSGSRQTAVHFIKDLLKYKGSPLRNYGIYLHALPGKPHHIRGIKMKDLLFPV